MTAQTLPSLSNYYQPVPFEEYIDVRFQRRDCEERYRSFKQSFYHKKVIDFGCAEGYFLFRALQDGANFAVGVESSSERRDFTNTLGLIMELPITSLSSMPSMSFDIGIYLDLWGDDGHNSVLERLVNCCGTLYVSPCKTGGEMNPKLEEELKHLGTYSQIHTGLQERNIYMVRRGQ